MDFHQELHQFPGCDVRSGNRRMFEFADECAESLDLELKFLFACHTAPFLLATNPGPNELA